MVVETVTRETYRCDVCGKHTEIVLTECPICGKGACIECYHLLHDVFHTNICKSCLEHKDIYAHFLSYWRYWGEVRATIIKDFVDKFGK